MAQESLNVSQIIELGKQVGREVNAAELPDLLFDPRVAAQIHLGAVVAKDVMLNPEITEVMRTVPEDIDS